MSYVDDRMRGLVQSFPMLLPAERDAIGALIRSVIEDCAELADDVSAQAIRALATPPMPVPREPGSPMPTPDDIAAKLLAAAGDRLRSNVVGYPNAATPSQPCAPWCGHGPVDSVAPCMRAPDGKRCINRMDSAIRKPGGLCYCSESCRDAGKPLNPATPTCDPGCGTPTSDTSKTWRAVDGEGVVRWFCSGPCYLALKPCNPVKP